MKIIYLIKYIIVFLILFNITNLINAKTIYKPLELINESNIKEYGGNYEWELNNTKVGFINDEVYSLISYYDSRYTDNENITYLYIKDKVKRFTNKNYKLFNNFDNYIYYYNKEDNKLTKLDSNLDIIGSISLNLKELNYITSNPNGGVILLTLDKNFTWVKLNNKDTTCTIYNINKTFNNITLTPCTTESLEEYFPKETFLYKNEIEEDKLSINKNNKAYIKDNKLYYLENNNIVFIKEPSTNSIFDKIKLLEDVIVATENSLYNETTKMYKSRIIIYDNRGNILQTINNDKTILDIDTNQEKTKLVILYGIINGSCERNNHLKNCSIAIKSDTYNYVEKDVLENNNATKPKKATKTNVLEVITALSIILLFTILFFILKPKKYM